MNLEVRAGDAGCDLFEERLLDPHKLRWLDHIQDLLDLPQKHHLNTHTQHIVYKKIQISKNAPGDLFYFFISAVSPLSACRFLAST